jgi:hypothetical protein
MRQWMFPDGDANCWVPVSACALAETGTVAAAHAIAVTTIFVVFNVVSSTCVGHGLWPAN